MNLCQVRGSSCRIGHFHQCMADRMTPDIDQPQCEFYERSNNKIDPGYCKYSFDADGMCTDECMCPDARRPAMEKYRKFQQQHRESFTCRIF
jgi:hypothetical protein